MIKYTLIGKMAELLADAYGELRQNDEAEAWAEQVREQLVAVVDLMAYDEIITGGTLSRIPTLLAMEEGWCLIESAHGVEIQKDDDSEIFDTDDAARVFVRLRQQAGSKLHAIAWAIDRATQKRAGR